MSNINKGIMEQYHKMLVEGSEGNVSQQVITEDEKKSPEDIKTAKEYAVKMKDYFTVDNLKKGQFGEAWLGYLDEIASNELFDNELGIGPIAVEPLVVFGKDNEFVNSFENQEIANEVYSYYFNKFMTSGGSKVLTKLTPHMATEDILFSGEVDYEWEDNTSSNNDPQYDVSGSFNLNVEDIDNMQVFPQFSQDGSKMELGLKPYNEDMYNDILNNTAQAHIDAQSEY